MGEFYVYIMLRPSGRPCYVGKGKGKRYREMYRYHNPHLRRIIKDAGGSIRSVKIRENLTESEALAFERLTIALLGRERYGGVLVNDTDGGDGMTGWVPSPETRANISKANTGRKNSDEVRAKMSASHKARGGPSSETRAKIAAANRARKGIPLSVEACANIKAAKTSPEQRKIHSDIALAQHARMTDEQKAERARKISAATREAMKDSETIQRVKDAARIAHLRRARTPEGRFA